MRTLLFRTGGTVYGCELGVVREIIPQRRATRLPGAARHVQGLINLRGAIVTVLDLGARLNPAQAHDGASAVGGSIILVDHGARVVGVAVDEVMDVQEIAPEPVDDAMGESRGGLVRGLGHLGDGVVVLIDIHALIAQVLLQGANE